MAFFHFSQYKPFYLSPAFGLKRIVFKLSSRLMLRSLTFILINLLTINISLASITQLPVEQLEVTAYSDDRRFPAANAFNGKGLSGGKHNSAKKDMWYSYGYSLREKWIKVDLGGAYNLDHLKVWNFNQANAEDRGIQTADILTSLVDPGNNVNNSKKPLNPEGWDTAVRAHQFARSEGGDAIDATDEVIDLGGVQAAYLLIRIMSNHTEFMNHVGLAEVEIYTTDELASDNYDLTVINGQGSELDVPQGASVTIMADEAPIGGLFDQWTRNFSAFDGFDAFASTTTFNMPNVDLTITAKYKPVPVGESVLIPSAPFVVTTFAEKPDHLAVHALDGLGVHGDFHSNFSGGMWLSRGYNVKGKWVKVDLGKVYNLHHMDFWNYNATRLWRGIKQADIYVAITDPSVNINNGKSPFKSQGWTKVLDNQTFTQASGEFMIPATDKDISLGGIQARYFAISVDSSFGSGGDVGFSEIQLYETVE